MGQSWEKEAKDCISFVGPKVNTYVEQKQSDEPKSCMTIRTLEESEEKNSKVKARSLILRNMAKRRRMERTGFNGALSVSFQNLTMREYPIILGDNPAGTVGPPLSIDWDYIEPEMTISIDEYEKYRPPRRNGSSMLMPLGTRVATLKLAKFSRREIVEMSKTCKKIRIERRRSHATPETIEEGIELILGTSVFRFKSVSIFLRKR